MKQEKEFSREKHAKLVSEMYPKFQEDMKIFLKKYENEVGFEAMVALVVGFSQNLIMSNYDTFKALRILSHGLDFVIKQLQESEEEKS